MIYKIFTDGPEETVKLGRRIGSLLRGGEVIELKSDLGGGKTTLMKGILSGLGYEGDVPSPTYTISRVYGLKNNLELHHFDFYRIQGADVVVSELEEAVGEPNVIVAVEWPNNINGDVLPGDRIMISLNFGSSDRKRAILVETTSKKYDYVIAGLAK